MFGKKDIIRGSILAGIVIIVYNVLAFVVPFAHTGTFWVSYAFTWVAFLFGFGTIAYSFSNGADAKNWFYGFPVAKAGAVYLIAQLIIGLLGMLLAKWMLTWIWVVVTVIPLIIAVFRVIGADSTRDEIQRMDEKLVKDVKNIRSLQSKSATLSGLCEDKETASLLESLAEKFKYSDPVSCDESLKLENELEELLSEIEKAIVDDCLGDVSKLCKKVTVSLNERNRICKLNKGK
ncbi:MAG: hypothetical protein IJ433_03640 [Ruminococcus sp.]|nr:hypothetical protein [Ruminococcus sp.]